MHTWKLNIGRLRISYRYMLGRNFNWFICIFKQNLIGIILRIMVRDDLCRVVHLRSWPFCKNFCAKRVQSLLRHSCYIKQQTIITLRAFGGHKDLFSFNKVVASMGLSCSLCCGSVYLQATVGKKQPAQKLRPDWSI